MDAKNRYMSDHKSLFSNNSSLRNNYNMTRYEDLIFRCTLFKVDPKIHKSSKLNRSVTNLKP